MSHAPDGGRNWKEELLAGHVDRETARRAGELLAAVHADPGERVRRPDSARPGTGRPVSPDGGRGERRRRGARPRGGRAAASDARCLVLGDWSPKNLLVYPDRVIALDFEVVHRGDPAFDVAFLLTHLVMKSVHMPEHAADLRNAADAFLAGYGASLPEAHLMAELGCLLLARVDGKSPAEYLHRTRARGGAHDCERGSARPSLARGGVRLKIDICPWPRDPRLAWSADRRGGAQAVRRHDRPRERPVGRIDRTTRGGRAARRRSVAIPRSRRPPRCRERERRDRGRFARARRRPPSRRPPTRRARRHAGQVPPRRQRDPGRFARVRPRRGRARGRPALAPSRRSEPLLPLPMVNIFSGGLHAGRQLDFQDFLVVPVGAATYREALRIAVAVYEATADVLRDRGLTRPEGRRGRLRPAARLARRRARAARHRRRAGGPAAGRRRRIRARRRRDALLTTPTTAPTSSPPRAAPALRRSWRSCVAGLADRHPILSVEDALAEDDWDGLGRVHRAARRSHADPRRRPLHDEPRAARARHRPSAPRTRCS